MKTANESYFSLSTRRVNCKYASGQQRSAHHLSSAKQQV
ncbi:hypothetical protein PAMC26577_21625 [Caballeronia sordidicola]|uniref:Uncharacterized protein n=1 Tax=Caballeronia sordidicola TaxID=196367 RepID=A0A242MLN3_CABSO|nr:hypothetical protein PAMC26577_21625 [Caballeronia sordidicola]